MGILSHKIVNTEREVMCMDGTWSVRMPEDMKEKISTIITESGLNAKDFLAQIIQAYELKTSRKPQPVMESDIEELTQLTGRINNIFINLCERVTNLQKQQDEEFNSKLSEKDDMFAVFNNRIKIQEEKLLKYEEEAEGLRKQYEDLGSQYANLNEVYETQKALVLEYREKNDTLTGLLSEYKDYKNIINNLKKELDDEKMLRQSVEFKLDEKDKEITYLKTQIDEMKKSFQDELEHKLDLSHIQKEKEILEIRKECQQNLISVQNECAGKIKELLSLIDGLQRARSKKKGSAKSSSENM